MESVKARVTKFDLAVLGRRLKSEPAWREKRRNSFVLLKDRVRHVYLVALPAAACVPDHRAPCPVDVHVIEGKARIITDLETLVLGGGDLAVVEAGTRYRLESEKETLLLLEFFPSGVVPRASEDEDDYFDNWD